MGAPCVSPAPPTPRQTDNVHCHSDAELARCPCSSANHRLSRPRRHQQQQQRRPRRQPLQPRSSFVALAVGALAVMSTSATAVAAGAAAAPPIQQDATVNNLAVAGSPPHLPSLTHKAAHEASRQLHVDSDTITHFTRELGLVKRDPRPEDREDLSGSRHAPLQRRDSDSGSDSDSSSSSKPKPTSTSTSSSSSSSSSSDSDSPPSPLPSPFDNTPITAFKSPGEDDSCPNFIKGLLADSTFKNCYPLSMLMFSSTSFFQAQKGLTSIVRVLDAACAADSSTCADFMTTAAKNLVAKENCKTEIDNGQNKVVDALNGLRAYSVMYSATCLQDPKTETYCFASAVTNTTNPSDVYFYSLPYNLSLPGSSTPSCGWCTTETMAIFHSATSDDSLPISKTYKDAARQVNTICGPDFVNGTALSAARLGSVPNVNNAVAGTLLTLALTLGTFWL